MKVKFKEVSLSQLREDCDKQYDKKQKELKQAISGFKRKCIVVCIGMGLPIVSTIAAFTLLFMYFPTYYIAWVICIVILILISLFCLERGQQYLRYIYTRVNIECSRFEHIENAEMYFLNCTGLLQDINESDSIIECKIQSFGANKYLTINLNCDGNQTTTKCPIINAKINNNNTAILKYVPNISGGCLYISIPAKEAKSAICATEYDTDDDIAWKFLKNNNEWEIDKNEAKTWIVD